MSKAKVYTIAFILFVLLILVRVFELLILFIIIVVVFIFILFRYRLAALIHRLCACERRQLASSLLDERRELLELVVSGRVVGAID